MKSEHVIQLAGEAALLLTGLRFEAAAWRAPVLSIRFGGRGRRHYLVVLVGSPGPVAFLRQSDPLEGIETARRFRPARGARVAGVEKEANTRVLRVLLGGSATRRPGAPEPAGNVPRRPPDKPDARGEYAHPARTDRSGQTSGPTSGSFRIRLYGSAGGVHLERGNAIVERVGRGPEPAATKGGQTGAAGMGRTGRIPEHETSPASAPKSPDDRPVSQGPSMAAPDQLLAAAYARIVNAVARPLRRRLNAQRRLVSRLDDELAEAADHARMRQIAESFAACQSQIPPGSTHVQIPDLYNEGATIELALDPALPVHRQVEKRFRRARRLARRIEHAQRHRAQVIHDMRRIETALEETTSRAIEGATSQQCAEFISRLVRLQERARILPSAEKRTPAPAAWNRKLHAAPRQFNLDSMWFVVVGRNNHENDTVTFHIASPGDLWFHAQGVTGAHVVLKSRGSRGKPPARVIERAASIAAHYSRARHSALVPVIYTERRYVRKFHGAAPGQVRCEREKLLVVPPVEPSITDGTG